MKLHVGDLVKLSPIAGGTASLRESLQSNWLLDEDRGSPTIMWGGKDVGIIVALERADGRNVLVMNHRGSGWIPGGYLTVV